MKKLIFTCLLFIPCLLFSKDRFNYYYEKEILDRNEHERKMFIEIENEHRRKRWSIKNKNIDLIDSGIEQPDSLYLTKVTTKKGSYWF
jgi:hypothetical protein